MVCLSPICDGVIFSKVTDFRPAIHEKCIPSKVPPKGNFRNFEIQLFFQNTSDQFLQNVSIKTASQKESKFRI